MAIDQQSIHVEGMDLAGKSTLTRALVLRRPGAALHRNALTEGNAIYALADDMRRRDEGGAEVLGRLYLAALAHDLARYVRPAGPVVQDSTVLLRSLAYYRARGDRPLADAFADLAARHPRFGRSIVLTADLEARRRRLASRRRDQPDEVAPDDELVERDPGLFFRMEAALVEAATALFGAEVVDTSGLAPVEVLARVEALVGSR